MPILGTIASQISGHLTPPDTGAMFPLGMVSVGSAGAANITFSSIPSTYKHLQIRAMSNTNRATYGQDDVFYQVNSDTGSNYSRHQIQGDGAAATAGGVANASSVLLNAVAGTTVTNMFGVFVLDILDYANTNKYKTFRTLGGVDSNGTVAGFGGQSNFMSGSWRNTNAITSITFYPTQNGATLFTQYSSFALYGIKGA